MKVLMIAPQPFFEPRGTPISIYQRLHGLSSLGHEVDLLTLPLGIDVDLPRLAIHRTMGLPFITRVKIGPSAPKLLFDILLFFKAIQMLLTRRYDVIHSHEEAAFFAVVLAKLFGVPHIYDMHSSLPEQLRNFEFCNWWPFVALFRWLEGSTIRGSSAVLTIGADLEKQVIALVPNANHILIENMAGSMTTAPQPEILAAIRAHFMAKDRPLVVYTGNFERYQGIDLLIDSIGLVVQQRPDVVLAIVGGTPQQVAACKARAESLALGNNVVFTGTVSAVEAVHFLFAADILVSPRTDGLSVPLKIYSYLRSGRPTVATNIYAHTQILNENISVITEQNPESYSAGILRLVNDPQCREEFGMRAQAFAKAELSLESYLDKLEQAYLSILLATPIRELAGLRRNAGTRGAQTMKAA